MLSKELKFHTLVMIVKKLRRNPDRPPTSETKSKAVYIVRESSVIPRLRSKVMLTQTLSLFSYGFKLRGYILKRPLFSLSVTEPRSIERPSCNCRF